MGYSWTLREKKEQLGKQRSRGQKDKEGPQQRAQGHCLYRRNFGREGFWKGAKILWIVSQLLCWPAGQERESGNLSKIVCGVLTMAFNQRVFN